MGGRKFWIGLLGVVAALLLGTTSVRSAELSTEQQQVLGALGSAQIIYLGEIHNSPTDHADQLTILQNFQGQGQPVALGLEMFQRPFQGVLDRYLAGQIGEEELRQQSEFDRRWGFPWEQYAPLLRLAKAEKWPVVALNTPVEITRKVARQGLESLTGDDWRYIPPAAEIDRTNSTYQQQIFAAYQQHRHQAQMNSKSFERFYEAQLLWDETMAAAAAQFYRQHPRTKLVVIAGQAHINYGYGIPDRVTRRLQDMGPRQMAVILSSPDPWDARAADFRWRVEKK